MPGTITIAYGTHRRETLPAAVRLMQVHQAIILEEPRTPGFDAMLAGHLGIDAYLEETDFEFPEFTRASCVELRQLHHAGKVIYQVDPFMDLLLAIHGLFADGGRPADIAPNSPMGTVYAAEKDWSAALIRYYELALTAPFPAVLEAVKAFARSDAARGRLRDRMRAQAVAALAGRFHGLYLEAGSLHLALHAELRRALPAGTRLRIVHLLEPVVRALCGKRVAWGPGDILTLLYTFRPDYRQPRADLLAARSLIHIKLLAKEELDQPAADYPHTRDEVATNALVGRLTLADCEHLYQRIKGMGTWQAGEYVRAWLAREGVPGGAAVRPA